MASKRLQLYAMSGERSTLHPSLAALVGASVRGHVLVVAATKADAVALIDSLHVGRYARNAAAAALRKADLSVPVLAQLHALADDTPTVLGYRTLTVGQAINRAFVDGGYSAVAVRRSTSDGTGLVLERVAP